MIRMSDVHSMGEGLLPATQGLEGWHQWHTGRTQTVLNRSISVPGLMPTFKIKLCVY